MEIGARQHARAAGKSGMEVHVTIESVAYTINEASKATGIGYNTLHAAIRARELKAVRVGAGRGKWIIPAKYLDAWLDDLMEAQG